MSSLLLGVIRYSDYTIATKLLPGRQGGDNVEVTMPRTIHPRHPLIQCEAPTTRLNGWFWEVGGQ